MWFVFCFFLYAFSLNAVTFSLPDEMGSSIGVKTYSFYDKVRNRPVTVEFWFPTNESMGKKCEHGFWVCPNEIRDAQIAPHTQSFALIVMSHGYGGDGRDRSWLAERLVREGYIVASVEHYGNTRSTLDPVATLKFWERSEDISFVLDEMLSHSEISSLIDRERIGFVGYSLGGMTGLCLAGALADELEETLVAHKALFLTLSEEGAAGINWDLAKQSYRDPRIKAFLLLAPATWCFGKPGGFAQVSAPIGIVATVTDEVLSFKEHIGPLITHAIPVRIKILKNQASHSVFLNRATKLGKAFFKEHVYRDLQGVSRRAVHREVGTFATDFFLQYL